MSYTHISGAPNDTRFSIREGHTILEFTCPRCEEKQLRVVSMDELFYGFEAICFSNRCTAPGERTGYELNFTPSWSGNILGLNDRPLH
jgi:hypothetical protein